MYPYEKDKAHFFKLLTRYNAGEANPEEIEFVERYMNLLDRRASGALENFEQERTAIGAGIHQQLINSIREEAAPVKPQPIIHRIHFLRQRKWWAAASIAILLAGGGFFLLRKEPVTTPRPATLAQDIPAGKTGAILTLSDGTQVVLDSLGNGVVAIQNGTEIQLKDQQLVYNKKGAHESVIAYNTMSTPRGRQFQLTLPDGTKVWLNAVSSLTYPTVFTGKERKVKITGEAYFEIAQNVNMPFEVNVDDGTAIQVLGTHFNVNAYRDGASVNTTLLQGSVRVKNAGESHLLKPGQQAQVYGASGMRVENNVNLDQVVAWKSGVFSFNDADIMTVMRELSRWYDFEVEYQGILPNAAFSGEIDKSLSLAQVLKGLSKTRINYKIADNGKKLIILP